MLEVEYTTQFKKDLKLAKKQKNNFLLLQKVMTKIVYEEPLPPNFNDHLLSGNWKGHRELHLEPDWLLIYKIIQSNSVIFVRLGSHSSLFE